MALARADFEKALQLEPSNAEVSNIVVVAVAVAVAVVDLSVAVAVDADNLVEEVWIFWLAQLLVGPFVDCWWNRALVLDRRVS